MIKTGLKNRTGRVFGAVGGGYTVQVGSSLPRSG